MLVEPVFTICIIYVIVCYSVLILLFSWRGTYSKLLSTSSVQSANCSWIIITLTEAITGLWGIKFWIRKSVFLPWKNTEMQNISAISLCHWVCVTKGRWLINRNIETNMIACRFSELWHWSSMLKKWPTVQIWNTFGWIHSCHNPRTSCEILEQKIRHNTYIYICGHVLSFIQNVVQRHTHCRF